MKGILFKPWKIAAIAANPDKEWQTRRAIKPQPDADGGMTACFTVYDHNITDLARFHVGEVVYIKELVTIYDNTCDWTAEYADGLTKLTRPPEKFIREHTIDEPYHYTGRTMPSWAARYFIKILDVQACQTKDINFEDCEAEGVVAASSQRPTIYTWPDSKDWYKTAQAAYFALYDSINGKGAHEKNYDWRYTFKVVPHP